MNDKIEKLIDNLAQKPMKDIVLTILSAPGVNTEMLRECLAELKAGSYVSQPSESLPEFDEPILPEGLDLPMVQQPFIYTNPPLPKLNDAIPLGKTNIPINWVTPPDTYTDTVLYIMNESEDMDRVPIAVIPKKITTGRDEDKRINFEKCKKALIKLRDGKLKDINADKFNIDRAIKGFKYQYAKDYTIVYVHMKPNKRRPGCSSKTKYCSFAMFLSYIALKEDVALSKCKKLTAKDAVTKYKNWVKKPKVNIPSSDHKKYLRFMVPYGKGKGWKGKKIQNVYKYIVNKEYKLLPKDENNKCKILNVAINNDKLKYTVLGSDKQIHTFDDDDANFEGHCNQPSVLEPGETYDTYFNNKTYNKYNRFYNVKDEPGIGPWGSYNQIYDETNGEFDKEYDSFEKRRVEFKNDKIIPKLNNDGYYQKSRIHVPTMKTPGKKMIGIENRYDKCMENRFGQLQRKAAKHNVYVTGYRFGDQKFYSYIFNTKNKQWTQDRKKKPKGQWKSIQALEKLFKTNKGGSITRSGANQFIGQFQNVFNPKSKFGMMELSPMSPMAFGYIQKATKKWPQNRLYGQLYPLGRGGTAYFKGRHQGVSSTFSEQFSKDHGLWNPKKTRKLPGIASKQLKTQFQFGKRKSCFGNRKVKRQRQQKPNTYGKVMNAYTGKYQGGIPVNKYGYNGTQAVYGGFTGVGGYPALSKQTVSQGLVPF